MMMMLMLMLMMMMMTMLPVVEASFQSANQLFYDSPTMAAVGALLEVSQEDADDDDDIDDCDDDDDDIVMMMMILVLLVVHKNMLSCIRCQSSLGSYILEVWCGEDDTEV